jgi:hypothetical protein
MAADLIVTDPQILGGKVKRGIASVEFCSLPRAARRRIRFSPSSAHDSLAAAFRCRRRAQGERLRITASPDFPPDRREHRSDVAKD